MSVQFWQVVSVALWSIGAALVYSEIDVYRPIKTGPAWFGFFGFLFAVLWPVWVPIGLAAAMLDEIRQVKQ
jgi:hypothetical protein